jgi:hypothetical protein
MERNRPGHFARSSFEKLEEKLEAKQSNGERITVSGARTEGRARIAYGSTDVPWPLQICLYYCPCDKCRELNVLINNL